MHETGTPEVLVPEEVEAPTPSPGQVLVHTEIVPVAFYETLLRSGTFPFPRPLPTTFGFEAVGTLNGQRVFLMDLNSSGTYAEHVATSPENLTPIPENVSSEDAAAITVQGAVTLGLLQKAALTGNETVLIEVASGGVGGYLTQLARAYGAGRIIATAGGPAKAAAVRDLGADTVLDHTDPTWPEQLKEGEVDLVFDSIGGDSTKTLLPALARGTGRILQYGVLNGPPAITAADLIPRGLTLTACSSEGPWLDTVEAAKPEALKLVAEGRLKPRIDETLPLAEAAEAHRRIEARTPTGKLLLRP
ncbi:zinc-binding dehydrogenase [Actinomadura barringtoniae]|uniref:Zinc-binding dehydrogenase n=2 Tax=Actinomadura barringtoniae TaxID=1427535 RepID=A0A939T7A6_9ACTN|nr:zinc-binding dehydrogenase [Actinomadura barringtoniae]